MGLSFKQIGWAIDKIIANRVVKSDGYTTTLPFCRNGFRVQVNRDSFSWCSGHDFYARIRESDIKSKDDNDWLCIGYAYDMDNVANRIDELRPILDKEHEKLLSWGLKCHKRNLDYYVDTCGFGFHFIQHDSSAFGKYIHYEIDRYDGNSPITRGSRRSSFDFSERILLEMVKPFAFNGYINEIKASLTDKFMDALREFDDSKIWEKDLES